MGETKIRIIPQINTMKVSAVNPEILTNGTHVSFTRENTKKEFKRKKTMVQKLCSVRLLLLFSFVFQVLFMGVIAFTTSTIGLKHTTAELSEKILDNVVSRVAAQVNSIFAVPWELSVATYREIGKNPENFHEDFMQPQIWKMWQMANGQLTTLFAGLPNGDIYGYFHLDEIAPFPQYATVNHTKGTFGYLAPIINNETGEYNISSELTIEFEGFNITDEPWWNGVAYNNTNTHLWSNVYFDPLFPWSTFYTCLCPVFNEFGELQIVYGADLCSSTIRDYLEGIYVSPNTEIWIIEADTGALVASSNKKERTYADTSIQAVTYAVDSNIKIVREASIRILATDFADSFTETHDNIFVHAKRITENSLGLILVVAYPKSDFLGVVTKIQMIVIVVSVAAFAVSLAGGIYVMYLVTSPLTRLGQQMDVISEGAFESEELNKSAQRSSRLYEINSLQSDFHRMVNALRSFGKFVPVDIVRYLLRNNAEAVVAVAQKDLTVMFSDIKGFTQKVEEMSPQQLSSLLTDYLNSMCAVIVENDGTVDKFIGDAIMALWNVPTPVKKHPLLACSAALKSLKNLESLNRKWIMNGLPEIQCRIGIHSGKALVGNLGSVERLAYTAVGDNINLGSRLEALNKREVYNFVKEEYLCRFLDIVIVQGRTLPTHVYELVAKIGDNEISQQVVYKCETHSLAVSLFFEKKFEQAIEILRGLQLANPLASATLSNDWNGYLVLDEK